jgi:hypothetical protein
MKTSVPSSASEEDDERDVIILVIQSMQRVAVSEQYSTCAALRQPHLYCLLVSFELYTVRTVPNSLLSLSSGVHHGAVEATATPANK